MPWSEIWLVWVVLCVPLGVALAAYLQGARRDSGRSKPLIAVVLALWVPMTLGMYGWAWFDGISLWLITLDSLVNLVAIAGASVLADAVSAVRAGVAPRP